MTDTPQATTAASVPLTVVYDGWNGVNRNVVKAVASLTAEQLALPISTAHWPIGTLVQHIVNDRLWWFNLWMHEARPEEAAFMHWEDEKQDPPVVRPTAELVAGLNATWGMIERTLARLTVADLGEVVAQPAELTERERRMFGPSTRQEIIWHVLRHDIHHAGELSVGLGAHGLPIVWG